MASPEQPTTPNAYYDWLIMQLGSKGVMQNDGIYVYDTLIGGDHQGLPEGEIDFRIDDYECHNIQGAELRCTALAHRSQLALGRTWFNVQTFNRREDPTYELPVEFNYQIFQPAQVRAESLGEATADMACAALNYTPTPDEAVIYSLRERLIVPQPLESPYLQAIYNHLNQA